MLLCDLIVIFALRSIAAQLAPGRPADVRTSEVLAPLSYVLLTSLLGTVILERYVYAPACTVFVLTAFVHVGYLGTLVTQNRFALALLLARNICLVWFLVRVISVGQWKSAHRCRLPRSAWLLPGLVVGWVGLASLTTVTANDVWVQMRVGLDFVETHTVPLVDRYSAIAAGRPFIAYEWLAGVLWYVAAQPFDGALLSVINSAVAITIAACLLWALPRRARFASPIVSGVLFLCMYLVLYRMVLRPHVFTILFQAVLVALLECWRRDGNAHRFLWLIPVQVLWVNLHGGYLFSVVFLLLFASVAGALVMWPRLQAAEHRAFTLRDVGVLTAASLTCALLSMINPYGYRIFGLSAEMFFRGEYMKDVVYEWGSVLDGKDLVGLSTGNYPYFAMAWVALLGIVWILMLVRNTRVSLFDWMQLSVVTILSLQARRFLADFGVVTFAMLVRLATEQLRETSRLGQSAMLQWARPMVVALVVLLASTAHDGFASTSQVHAVPGFGFGGDQPYEEVAELNRIQARGVILNDYPSGALIIYRLYPRLRPVVDSRIDIYSPESLGEYGEAIRDPEACRRYTDKYGIDTVMLLRSTEQQSVIAWLDQQANWKRQMVTARRVIFVRR